MEYITSHHIELLLALHTIALAVVNLTPTPKDNTVYAKVYSTVQFFAGMITPWSKR